MHPAAWSDLESRILACRRCPRLVEWRERVAREKKRAYMDHAYWGKPVPGFGDPAARIVAIGLAPGAHGSNRTGRMFTGDASGDFLFPALFRAGLASQEKSCSREDGLVLRGLFLSAVCRCAPPENKPLPEEIERCAPFLQEELRLLAQARVLVALGGIAYARLARWFQTSALNGAAAPAAAAPSFAHGAVFRPGPGLLALLASYHPSRQNTNTGRLTRPMFDRVWRLAGELARE